MAKKQAKTALKQAHEAELALADRALDAGRHPLVRLAGKASEIADQPPLVALSAVAIVAGATIRSSTIARMGVRMLLSHALATGAKTLIKHSVDRTRPKAKQAKGYTLASGGKHGPDLASFPSGHTAGAVAIARAIGRDLPETAILGAVGATAIGAIQIPRGKHYLSDVLVGAAIGAVAEVIVSATMRRVEARFAKPEAIKLLPAPS